MTDRLNDINRTWTALRRRADRAPDPELLHGTFVKAAYFLPAAEPDSMVLFGRRGAGKTHTLLELRHIIKEGGNVPVYIDMRRLGSNSGIYDNPGVPFATRASRLLIDLVEVVHDMLFQLIVGDESDNLDLAKLGPALDDLGDASTQIRVKGAIAVTQGAGTKVSRSASKTAGVHVVRGQAALDLGISGTEGHVEEDSIALTREGTEEFYIHLGSLDRRGRASVQRARPVAVAAH